MFIRIDHEKWRPYAKTAVRFLFWPHLLVCAYCAVNLLLHAATAVRVGLEDFPFFATYLTLLFTFLGSLSFCGHVKGGLSFSIAALGCCQAGICGAGLTYVDNGSVVGNAALILHGTSLFILKYTLPFSVSRTVRAGKRG
jgi:hypothetical protein